MCTSSEHNTVEEDTEVNVEYNANEKRKGVGSNPKSTATMEESL